MNLKPQNSPTQTTQDEKHNPQAKTPILNWHKQHPNTTTIEKLKVLL